MANQAAPSLARRKTGALAAAVVMIGVAVLAYVLVNRTTAPPPRTTTEPAAKAPPPQPVGPTGAEPATTPAPAPGTQAPGSQAPRFDVVRIAPSGEAVIAGRAAPGSEVSVTDNGKVVGHGRADAGGNFVVIPDAPFAAGGRELALSAREPGGVERKSDQTVVLSVPEHPPSGGGAPAAGSGAVAVLSQPGVPSRLLQAPGNDTGRAPPGRLGLDVVDYDQSGQIRFSGQAPPGAALRLYVDNAPVGDTQADARGRWTLSPTAPIAAGQHKVRVDQLGPDAKVAARIELPFRREAFEARDVQTGSVVVQPGQNLWRIARAAYGRGIQYTVIYQANRDQIREPQLIYPGQVFAMPPGSAPPIAASPSSSSKSR